MRPNLQFPADLVTFTEDILNGKIFCAVIINVPLAPDTLESIWRLGECICKKAKLYYAALFTCSLDNDVVCKNQEIDYKRIVETSDVED